MAQGMVEAGANIIGVSASLELTGSAIQEAVTALGRTFAAYQADFSDRAAVKAFAARVMAVHATPDILVNNAGTINRKPTAKPR